MICSGGEDLLPKGGTAGEENRASSFKARKRSFELSGKGGGGKLPSTAWKEGRYSGREGAAHSGKGNAIPFSVQEGKKGLLVLLPYIRGRKKRARRHGEWGRRQLMNSVPSRRERRALNISRTEGTSLSFLEKRPGCGEQRETREERRIVYITKKRAPFRPKKKRSGWRRNTQTLS